MLDSSNDSLHRPVLLSEVMELMDVRSGGVYIDGTAGGGGHFLSLLKAIGEEGTLLGIDRDMTALKRTRTKAVDQIAESTSARFILEHGNFTSMCDIARKHDISQVDGILLDIGVSSDQLDRASRGFSFMQDGPLDMRMDQSQGVTAQDIVNDYSEDDLVSIIRSLGEEKKARRVAKAIVRARKDAPITSTSALADIVEKAVGGRRGPRHPATKTFQGIRMSVNSELDSLSEGLEAGLSILSEGGRMAVISFHSLEDRMVKHFFASHAGRWESLAAGGERWQGEMPRVKLVNRKPVMASDIEANDNPRSRSAKLRVVQRMGEGDE